MVALPIDRIEAEPQVADADGGWQSIRQQLFGEHRKREAEDRLIAVLTQLDARLAAATRETRGGPPRSPLGRAAVLRAVLEGANELFAWHREQCGAATAAGCWVVPARDEAAWALAKARTAYPLLEAAETRAHAIQAGDVIDSIAQLRGAESAGFYNEALAGLTSVLEIAYERLRLDSPTAPAAASLEGTWQSLLEALGAVSIQEVVAPANVMSCVEVVLGDGGPAPARRTNIAARFCRLELVAC